MLITNNSVNSFYEKLFFLSYLRPPYFLIMFEVFLEYICQEAILDGECESGVGEHYFRNVRPVPNKMVIT